MPFIGRDWRSPGEAWVKTESLGWQRAKIIESSTMHPTGCHLRSCNDYLDTSSCISPRSWPPKTECGKHMPKEKSQQKNLPPKRSQRNISHSWLKVVNSNNKINPIDIDTIGCGVNCSDKSCCCTKKLNCSFRNNKNASKSVSPDPRCCCSSSTDNGTDYTNDEVERSPTPSCPRSESANSASSLIESYNCEQELLTSTPTVQHRAPSPSSSSTSSLSSQDEQQRHDSQKQISQPISVIIKNEFLSSAQENNGIDPSPPSLENTTSRFSDGIYINNSTMITNHQSTTHPANDSITCQHHQHHHHHHCPRPLSPTSPALTPNHIIVKQAPHCQITLKPTREVATYNTISEAFYRLDFCNAIHDIRRFNYICKLLHLLITQNLTSLSGCATRILFTMLEQVAWQVASNKQNIHILYNLLDDLKKMIQKYYCWGRPIGSSLLWQQHFSTIERISHFADQIDISPSPNNSNSSQKTINDLPVEMIHEIMLRLNDYRDLVNSAGASSVMQSILNGQHIWRQLCKYHFTKQQLRLAIENHYGLAQSTPWSSNVKFARFVSADGRSICRRPVNQSTRNGRSKQSSSLQTRATRQPVKDTKNHLQENDPDQRSLCLKSRSSEHPNKSLTSLSPDTLPNELGNSQQLGGKESFVNTCQTGRIKLADKTNHSISNENTIGTNAVNNSGDYKHQPELDWEQVFHQLRKKFGLKEEYADCLLLCRHCRCLFWKSFGHPCIKGQPNDGDQSNRIKDSDEKTPNKEQRQVNENIDDQPMASVAALSQSYSRNAKNQSSSSNNAMSRSMLQVARSNLAHQPQPSNRGQNNPNVSNDNNIGNYNRFRSFQNGPVRRNIQPQENNLNPLGQQQQKNPGAIPSHVAISPQAFLKFFSL